MPKNNQTLRHLKALSKKNAINWRRTWCGSCLEFTCPIFLMLILLWARSLISPETMDAMNLYAIQQPFYAPATVSPVDGKWQVNAQSAAIASQSMLPFLNFTGYNASRNGTYNAGSDPKGPFAFLPPHCYQPQRDHNSPIIAVISQGNRIEASLVEQLQALFAAQKLQATTANPMFGNFTIQYFESKEVLFSYIQRSDYGLPTAPGICFGFQVFMQSLQDIEVELIFQDLGPSYYQSLPSQKNPAYSAQSGAPDLTSLGYYNREGYSLIQNWAANAVLKAATNNSNAQIATVIVPFKTSALVTDAYTTLLQRILPFFFLIMYIPLLYRTIYRIVFEKVTRAKESMRMMGMSDFAYWLSWFLYYTTVNTVLVSCAFGILMIRSLNRESAFFIWLFIWLYGESLFGLLIIIQSLFSSPRAAGITATVIYFGTSVLSVLVSDAETPRSTVLGVCVLFPTVTMITGVQPLVANAQSGVGITSKTLGVQFNNFSVGDAIWLFVIGGLINYLVGFYLEYVLPKSYGKQQHPCFFLLCCCRRKAGKTRVQTEQTQDMEHETKYLNSDCFEPVDHETAAKEEQKKIIKISDLFKVYDNGFKAVNGLNLKMYQDQIFVLLGHNGAGKTTTISMLTGLFEQSSGSASIFGIDMFTDMDKVRSIMGVCPQYDVLFELLTTEEHLEFFYDLKGADKNLKKAEIHKLMKDVGIWDKRSALAYQLSGGNKRKLSVAIALCGHSKFVLLDEPTSGMDLSARRQLWNMLKEQKKDRIIVLTTHYMDEADILGDRIGIMASGKMTALGSSMFLKSKFGVGYNLVAIKSDSNQNPAILEYFTEHLGPKVCKQSEIQSELTLTIPIEYADKFGVFFKDFDRALASLNIRSYGISISTLEEVFLKVGHLEDPSRPLLGQSNELKDLEKGVDRPTFNLQTNLEDLDNSFSNNLFAVLFKRYANYKRNKKAILNEAIIPALVILGGIGLTQIPRNWQSPSLVQSPSRLPMPQQLLMNPTAATGANTSIINSLYKNLPSSEQFQVNYANGTNFTNFGDLIYDSAKLVVPYQYGAYQIFEANPSTQQYKFVSWVNTTSQDAAGLFPLFMYQSILKTATNNTDFKFTVRSSPYPATNFLLSRVSATAASTVLFVSAIGYSMMITAVASYLVVERINGLKHLQVISGMQLKAYWVGNFIFDFGKMQMTILVTIALFFAFNLEYNSAWLTYLILPFGILPYTYVTSFIFSADSAAQTFTMFYHFFIIAIVTLFVLFLRLLPTMQRLGDLLNLIFRLVPTYLIGQSVYCDSSCVALANGRLSPQATGSTLSENPWAMSNNGLDILAMFIHFAFWMIQLYLIEKGFWSFCRRRPNEDISSAARSLDQDVLTETRRVKHPENKDIIKVVNFKKVYATKSGGCCVDCDSSFVAVSNLNFGVSAGEVFALLGVNGAGKSTTFKSLTYEVTPTEGTIQINGYDVQKDFDKARRLVGYCPQSNLIFVDMTVEEHLIYFAQVKGIPQIVRKELIEESINELGLGMHRTKPAGTLSGGNKRKLCVALALLGNPPIIFLDEPSAGMDPESRRFMWSIVGKIAQKKKSAVVLTTHSMEEAEALSTKMGIMVKGGVFKCFGTAQHIRDKFGTGYVIEIKVKTLSEEQLQSIEAEYFPLGQLLTGRLDCSSNVAEAISKKLDGLMQPDLLRQIHAEINLHLCIQELCRTFGQVELLEKYGNFMKVRVQRLDKSIGAVFGLVVGFKQQFDVSEYSVGQTTLEQIFQSFADVAFTENVVTYTLQGTQLHSNLIIQ